MRHRLVMFLTALAAAVIVIFIVFAIFQDGKAVGEFKRSCEAKGGFVDERTEQRYTGNNSAGMPQFTTDYSYDCFMPDGRRVAHRD